MKKGPEWYRGTADAIYQNIDFIEREKPDCVAIFGGDHIYKMDIEQLVAFHTQKDADLTVSAIAHDIKSAGSFGVLAVDKNNRITDFIEKPENPAPLPGRPDKSFVSMGIYLFKAEVICEILEKDATTDSDHDFGKDIITELIEHKKVFAYDFADNEIPGMEEKERGYWRDIGSIDQYWKSSMDLVSVSPVFNLYNRKWPIKCYYPPAPPAKFVFADIESRAGIATDSLVAEGCIISGGRIDRSILSPHCHVHSYCHVLESVLMEGVIIGRNASVKKTIIDKNVVVPEGEKIGYDLDKDRERFTVTDNGVVVIAKNSKIQRTS